MKKSEILAILGSNVVLNHVIVDGEICKWLEIYVNRIEYTDLKKIFERILYIEAVDERMIKIVFDSDTIIDKEREY